MAQKIKRATTYEEQIQKLKERGCYISDEAFCKLKLKAVNYYRLKAYFFPFIDENGNYKDGTSFHQVYRIYEFDRKLRAILFSAVEEVEIYLRSQFSYFHVHKYGATGYLDADSFSENKRNYYERFQQNIQREIDRNCQVAFVKHHIKNYDGVFPLWAVSELFTFGMLSRFYNNLKTADQKALARGLYKTSYKNISSWLRCCTDLRNICAHYGRLYCRVFSSAPGGMDAMSEAAKHRLWGTVMALRGLYPDADKWNSEVLSAMERLLEEYRGDISLYHIAFPENWACELKKK